MNRYHQKKAPYIILYTLSLVFIIGLYSYVTLNDKKKRVSLVANSIYLDLREKIKANEIILSGFEALVKSVKDPEYINAKKYAKEIVAKYPHIYMFEIIDVVRKNERESFERSMSRRLGYKYEIKGFDYAQSRNWFEVADKNVYYPVSFMYPERPEARAVYGLDIFSEPHLKEAALKAISQNSIYSSKPFELAEGGSGYVIFKPVGDATGDSQPRRLVALLVLTEQLINPLIYNTGGLDIHLISEDYSFELQLAQNSNRSDFSLKKIDYVWLMGDKDRKFILHIGSALGWDNLNILLIFIIIIATAWLYYWLYKYQQDKHMSADMQARFGKILDNSINEIFVFDVDGLKFQMVNQGAQNNLGYTLEELLDMTPYDIKPNYNRQKFIEVIEPLIHGDQDSLQFNTTHQRKDGSTYPVEVNLQLYHDEQPNIFVAIILDISERIKDQEKLTYLAKYDELTNLPNRTLFRDRLLHAMKVAKRNNRLLGLMFIDVDNFKTINDTLGHDVGDELLKSIAGRIQGVLRSTDTVSRIGGDEFTIIIEDCEHGGQFVDVANKIHKSFLEPFALSGKTIFSNVSIGISIYPSDATNDDDLIKAADAAMYQAKDNGRSRYHFYTRDMNQIAMNKLELENDLRQASMNESFELYYQPQIDLQNNNIIAYEALIRWQHEEKGFISPDKFIPVAEDSGLILEIGEWVFRNAIYQALMWNALDNHNHHISINISGRQFLDKNFFNKINKLLSMVDGLDHCMELEITESVILQNLDENIRILKSLKDKGMRIAVDDFGTGYSSLNYLKKLPIDTLKIDRSFVSGVCDNRQDEAIAATIITLGKNLNLNVIAEGVETKQQLDFLSERGCDAVQGFYISKPLPAADVDAWHTDWTNNHIKQV